jgi:hypothetical protein
VTEFMPMFADLLVDSRICITIANNDSAGIGSTHRQGAQILSCEIGRTSSTILSNLETVLQ